jgi:hypothetical protein
MSKNRIVTEEKREGVTEVTFLKKRVIFYYSIFRGEHQAKALSPEGFLSRSHKSNKSNIVFWDIYRGMIHKA